jgi:hypothetical protein
MVPLAAQSQKQLFHSGFIDLRDSVYPAVSQSDNHWRNVRA